MSKVLTKLINFIKSLFMKTEVKEKLKELLFIIIHLIVNKVFEEKNSKSVN